MKNFFNKKFSTKTKLISSAISMMLIVCFAITGTVAWLTAKTDTVQDKFTFGKVNIELTDGQTDNLWSIVANVSNRDNNNNKLIPGATIPFDPYVKVVEGSEECYVFVKLTEVGDPRTYFDVASMASGWQTLSTDTTVYYRTVTTQTDAQYFPIFAPTDWKVKTTLTNTDFAAIQTTPTITITAYAIQQNYLIDANGNAVTTPEAAWALINP